MTAETGMAPVDRTRSKKLIPGVLQTQSTVLLWIILLAYSQSYVARELTVGFEDLLKKGDTGTWLRGLCLKMALHIQNKLSPNDQG